MQKTNLKQFSTAFPAFPSQDQFGRVFSPFPGMLLLDYFALTIYANNLDNISAEEAVNFAQNLIQKLAELQSDNFTDTSTLTAI